MVTLGVLWLAVGVVVGVALALAVRLCPETLRRVLIWGACVPPLMWVFSVAVLFTRGSYDMVIPVLLSLLLSLVWVLTSIGLIVFRSRAGQPVGSLAASAICAGLPLLMTAAWMILRLARNRSPFH